MPTNTAKVEVRIGSLNGFAQGLSYDIITDGVQMEKSSYASSYIPTTTATASRNHDVTKIPTSVLSSSAGTVIGLGYNTWSRATNKTLLSIYPTSGNANMLSLYGNTSTRSTIECAGSDAVVSWRSTSAPSQTDNTYVSFSMYWNGATVAVNDQVGVKGSGPIGSALNAIPSNASIGIYRGSGGSNNFNGSIARIALYSTGLSDADITTVSNSIKNGL